MFNQITNYQASFSVKAPDQEAMHRLKSILFNWLKRKESDFVLRDHNAYKDFCFRTQLSNLWNTRSSITTNTYISDESTSWALQYQEQKPKDQMFWYTDVGLTQEEGILTAHIRISYAWDTENLSHKRQDPMASIPRFVRNFFDEAAKKNWFIFSQNETFRIASKPFPISQPGEGKILADWIQNPERQFPLIVFNGRSLVEEACILSRDLVGKANIIVIDDNENLAEEIKTYLPKDLRVPFNKFRVFFRINQKNPRPERHRWFAPSDADYTEQREALVYSLLRNHTIAGNYQGRTVEKLADVGRLITLSKLRKAATEGTESPEQMALFEELLSAAEDEREEHKKEAEFYATEHGVIEQENKQLKSKLHAFQNATPQGQQQSHIPPALPSNLEECVEAIESFISPKIVIHPDAKKSAADYPECQSVNECWRMLHALHETMHPLKFVEKKFDEAAFKNRTGIDFAKTEGKQTKSDKRLAAMRAFNHEGADFEMWSHLKYGTKGDKILRIHFAFDEKSKRIIVGHIGKHMENATTRNL